MSRIRWIYALLIVMSLALHGCGEEGTGAQDASDEKDAASGDSGLDERDPDNEDDEDDEGEKDDDDEDDEKSPCDGVTCADDGNICTENVCNPSTGECETVLLSHVSCDDGLFCTGNDVCVDGICTHSGNPCGAGDACAEELKTCGCATEADCPAGDWGAWSECDCDDPENVCKNTGTRTRTRVTYACEDALCVATDTLEVDTESCSCDTDAIECIVPGLVVAGECNWGLCASGSCAPHQCASPLGKCDNDAKRCVECTSNAHCSSADKPYCDTAAGACVGCRSDSDCGGSTPHCHPDEKRCVGCHARSHCCSDGLCLFSCCEAGTFREYTCGSSVIGAGCHECTTDAHCGDGEVCCTSGTNINKCVISTVLCNPVQPYVGTSLVFP